MDSIQIRVSDLVYQIKKRWAVILALTVAGLIAGIILTGASYLQGTMTKNYEVTASAVFITKTSGGNFTLDKKDPDISDYRMASEMAQTVRYIVKSDRVLSAVIDKNNLIGITPKDISDNMKVSVETDTPVLEFSLSWRSAEEGTAILSTLLTQSTSALKEILKVGELSAVDEPSARYIVGGSMNAPIWGIMLFAGFALGLGIAVLELLLRPTLINTKDVPSETGLDTIGIIPENGRYFNSLGSMLEYDESSTSEIRQDYSAVSHILKNRVGTGKKPHTLYVTSSIRGEGRTTASAHLAVQLSEMENRVLLIDFDTRNPGLSSLFLKNVDYAHSLNALYRGEITEREAVTSLTGYLDILPVMPEHTPVPVDTTVFDLVRKLSEGYDYVIMDTAPVGEISDTLSLNQVADASLLVIGFDMATKTEIRDTVEKMEKSGISVVGCIVNREKSVETGGFFKKEPAGRKKNAKKNRKTGAMQATSNTSTAETAPHTAPDKASAAKPYSRQENAETAQKQDKTDAGTEDGTDRTDGSVPEKTLTDEEAMNALLEIGLGNGAGTDSTEGN